MEGDLYARIIWFYSAPKVGDIDNIPKNILDALNGTVYADDRSIVQITILRVKMGDIDFRANTLPEEVRQQIFIELTEALAYGPDHLLYIEVGSVKERRVSFGPVDGGMR